MEQFLNGLMPKGANVPSSLRKLHWQKILIKIIVLAQYSCSIFIFLFILYRRILKKKSTVYEISYFAL